MGSPAGGRKGLRRRGYDRSMTRRDVRRLLISLGWVMILVGVLVALLVEDVLDYTLFDLAFGGANENGFDAPITWASPQLLVSVIVLLVLGVATLIFGAGLNAGEPRELYAPPTGWQGQPPQQPWQQQQLWQAPQQQPWQGQQQTPPWQQQQQQQQQQQPQQLPRDPWRPPPPPPS